MVVRYSKYIFLVLVLGASLGCKLAEMTANTDTIEALPSNPESTPPSGSQSFIKTWDFSVSGDYVLSDSDVLTISSNQVNLNYIDLLDDDNDVSKGFAAGTFSESSYISSKLKLTPTTNIHKLDASWTPQYTNLIGYWPMDGTVGGINDAASIVADVGNNGVVQNSDNLGLAYVNGKVEQGVANKCSCNDTQ